MIVHEGHTSWVNSVAFSPDGKSVASGSWDNTIRIWDAYNSTLIGQPLRGHSSSINSVSYSPLGDLIASGSTDKTIRLWNPNTGHQVGQSLRGDQSFVSIDFSPDARLIASGSGGPSTSPTGHAVQLWDAQSRTAVSGPLKGHLGGVESVSFSPEGTRVASGSFDKTIRVWDVESGATLIGPLTGHRSVVRSLSFSPDGTQMVSCSIDRTILLWDVRNGEIIGGPYMGHNDWVNSVSFSPRGTFVASGSSDSTVRVWDIRTGRQVVRSLEGHTDCVYSVAFSPSGQYIASGSYDCKVIVRRILAGDPDSYDDDGPVIVTSQMSTHEMFDCLRRAGCVDLSSHMRSNQENAVIVSGGGFGDIWMGELDNGVKIAIKTWRTYALGECDYKTIKRAARELYLWSILDHPNIHRLYGVIMFRDQHLGMVSEWMDNGNLHEYLRKHPSADRYQLCIQVASGLEYMHSRSMVHGDLKVLNVLVSTEGIAMLCDFDTTLIMSEIGNFLFSETSNSRQGGIRWVAPEMLGDDIPQKTTQTDVYALGMTMLEIITGEVPYADRRLDYAAIQAVLQGTPPTRPKELGDDQKGNKMWQLLLRCWSRNPRERPSSGQAVEALSNICQA